MFAFARVLKIGLCSNRWDAA